MFIHKKTDANGVCFFVGGYILVLFEKFVALQVCDYLATVDVVALLRTNLDYAAT